MNDFIKILKLLTPLAILILTVDGQHFTQPIFANKNFGYVSGGWRIPRHPRILGDVNGDGRADVVGFGNAGVYVSLGTSDGGLETARLVLSSFGFGSGHWRQEAHVRTLADVNGDGMLDIIGFWDDGVHVSLGKKNGNFSQPRHVLESFGFYAGSWRVERHLRVMGDVNGDGCADIVGFRSQGVHVALGKKDGTFTNESLVLKSFGNKAGSWFKERHPRFLVDVNEDGRADIVGFGNAGVYISNGMRNGSFSSPKLAVRSFGFENATWRTEAHIRTLADVNGDGLMDIIGFGDDGVHVSFGSGNGHFNDPQLVLKSYGYVEGRWRVDKHPRFMADVNGDGCADIVGFRRFGVHLSLGKKSGGFSDEHLVMENFGAKAGEWEYDKHPRMLGDINGDGRDDIVGFWNDGTYTSMAY